MGQQGFQLVMRQIFRHNLAEVIDAVVYTRPDPPAKVDKLMGFCLGLISPSGCHYQGRDEIQKAYETGKGGWLSL